MQDQAHQESIKTMGSLQASAAHVFCSFYPQETIKRQKLPLYWKL